MGASYSIGVIEGNAFLCNPRAHKPRLTKHTIAAFYHFMSVAPALRHLLARSIDYAGMFPPANLALEPALANQASYVRSADSWMLNAFVLPAAQFNAAKLLLSHFSIDAPLRVSALGPKTESASKFLDMLDETMHSLHKFAAFNVDLIEIEQLEMALPADADLPTIEEAQKIVGNLKAFWETPPDAAEKTIALLAEHNSNTHYEAFGYKLRTGGVTADAFPTSQQIARALVSPLRHQVPMKFTAGLHHPVRQFRDEVKTKMYGFLNVLGAAILAAEHQWDEKQAIAMLEEEDVTAFRFEGETFAWRDWEITGDRISARRRFVTSFGSCSFDEPREDLRALHIL